MSSAGKRHLASLAVLVLLGPVAACSSPRPAPPPVASSPSSPGSPSSPNATASPAIEGAPRDAFGVGVLELNLRRGQDRPLPSTVWYPATTKAGTPPKPGAAAAPGRFPVVVFSHGLRGLPEYYSPVTTRWAAAGFVVVAPTYPYTNAKATAFNVSDTINQPADAAYVLQRVLALDKGGAPLGGHLDTAHLGAGGHSAGGYTTAGMFRTGHDGRLKAGVVIAGGALGSFGGSSAAMLFVHGDNDPTVALSAGRTAYSKVAWPKAFLTLIGQGHGEYLRPGAKGFDETVATSLDFLRWSLYGDGSAKARLNRDGDVHGISDLTTRL